MKKKNLLLICALSIVIIFSISFLNKSDVKGIYDDSTGVYTNRYLNFEIATPPLLYIDKEFSSQNEEYREVNLLRLKNYLYDEQDINSKMDITCTATKLDDEFEVYLRNTFNIEQNKHMDIENANINKVQINNFYADYIEKENKSRLVWQDENILYDLKLDYTSKDKYLDINSELIKIAKNIN